MRYDGPDLARVTSHTGLSAAEVIRRHSTVIYDVYFLGFSPGFAYLGGLDPHLATPRLDTPRLRVPAGSVANDIVCHQDMLPTLLAAAGERRVVVAHTADCSRAA